MRLTTAVRSLTAFTALGLPPTTATRISATTDLKKALKAAGFDGQALPKECSSVPEAIAWLLNAVPLLSLDEVLRLVELKVDGQKLLQLTEEKLLAPPYTLPNVTTQIASAVRKLQEDLHQQELLRSRTTYSLVDIPEEVKRRLKSPENCLAFRLGGDPDARLYVHVGVQRVWTAVNLFSKPKNDATQQKHMLFVMGPPKSGKTSEVQVVAPHLLAPLIRRVVSSPLGKRFEEPCRQVYIDCSVLRELPSMDAKLSRFYTSLCRSLGVARHPDFKEGQTAIGELYDMIEAALEAPRNYHIVCLDEYHMLFTSLDAHSRQMLSTWLRNLMLDPQSPCQFVLTGSTNAALMGALALSIPNGISLFKDHASIRTDLDSSERDLRDVVTLLQHFYPGTPTPTEDDLRVMREEIGYVNCAALNIILGDMRHGTTVHEAARRHLKRILSIYQRDYEAVMRNYPSTYNTVVKYAAGSPDEPEPGWEAFLEAKAVPERRRHKNDGFEKLWMWREPLFVAFAALPRGPYHEPLIFDLQLMFRLIPLNEVICIDEDGLKAHLSAWSQDDSQLDGIYRFLAERRVAYYAERASAYPTHAAYSAADWLAGKDAAGTSQKKLAWIDKVRDPKTKKPHALRILREFRNCSIAHDEARDGKHTRRAASLLKRWLGKGNIKEAQRFLHEAQRFFS